MKKINFFLKKSKKVVPINLFHYDTLYEPVQNGFHHHSRKIAISEEKAEKHLFG